MRTRLTLIRHGHTKGNGSGPQVPMCGWTDLPLSREGEHQVVRLRARLRGRADFAAVYSSPLCRAQKTALPLLTEQLGPLRLRDALREIHCGEADGVAIGEVQQRFPAHWEANLRQDDPGFRWPGGESYAELRERVLGEICTLAGEHRGESIALVTHAGVVNQLLGAIFGLSPAQWEPYRPHNASVTVVDWDGVRGELVSFDDTSHLR